MTGIELPERRDRDSHAPPSALSLFSNPILRRYRRSQMRPVRLGVTIVITLVIAGFIATMVYLPLRHRLNYTEINAARAASISLNPAR